ncbi:hypothetical protein VB711_09815 [Cronbergia sp. UHCC 0137]|uniref:hypothetical protein n=1 Tax=Cronbergia sp. UHCC 0137 TaxID=3110239 RepID=UPI002B21D0FA|nr:hypothetical protein [Cronbergia sp. UHCC 0137]MEA5618129.1 hypothetical protein [Cronbergia sp. UHCC 0137]
MLKKIWVTRVLLTSLSLIFGVIVTDFNNATLVLAENPPESSQLVDTETITISKSEFGIKKVDSQGKVNFLPTNKVVLKAGDSYGWRIQLQNHKPVVTWREVLTLPKAPETWATQESDNFSISPDGTTATSKRKQTLTNGMIENFWTIAPGDPVGQHKIEVYIDQHLIGTFEFEIVDQVASY